MCRRAVSEKNEKRAIVYANELAEVRKIHQFLRFAQIALERVILRLETIKELHSIVMDMKPVLNALKDVTARLDELMPGMGYKLENVSQTIQETLVMTTLDAPESTIPVNLKTPSGEKILEEVSEFMEQKLARQLPEPPKQVVIPEKTETAEEKKEMVALTAACSQEAVRPEEASTTISYKNMKLQELSFEMDQPSSLENILLDYLKEREGRIDINKCALELNSSTKEIEKALENLNVKGRIKIKP